MATLDQVIKVQTNRRRAVEDIASGTRLAYNNANPLNPINEPISNSWLKLTSGTTDADFIAHEGTAATAVVRKGAVETGDFAGTYAELASLGLLDQSGSSGTFSYLPSAALSESISYQAQSVDVNGQPVILNNPTFHGGDNARLIQTLTSAPQHWIFDGQTNSWIEIAAHGTAQFELAVEGTGVTEVVREGTGINQVVREGNSADSSNVLRGNNLTFQSGSADAIIVPGTGLLADGGNGAIVGSFLVRNPAQIQLSDSHVFANQALRDAGVVPGGTELIVWHTGDVAFITDQSGDGMPNIANGTYLYTTATEKTGPTVISDWSRLNAPGSGVTSVVDAIGVVTEADIAGALGATSQQFINGASISFGDSDPDPIASTPVLQIRGDAASGTIESAGTLAVTTVGDLTLKGGVVPNNPHINDAAGVTADTNAVIADGIEVAIGSSGRFGTGADNISIQAVDADSATISTTGLQELEIGSTELTVLRLRTAPGVTIQHNDADIVTRDTRESFSVLVPAPAPGSTLVNVPYSSFVAGFENPGATFPAVGQMMAGTFDLYIGGQRLSQGGTQTGTNRRDYRLIGATSFELTFASVSDAEEPNKNELRLDLVRYS